MEKIIISPSILASDFSKIVEEVASVEECGLKWLHVDVMDGSFVPNITFGPKFIKDLRPHSSLYFDSHLMINQPEQYIEEFAKAGCDGICIHQESTNHIHRALQMIKSLGKDCGVSINPGTSIETIKPLLPMLDQVLVMTVNPGFGGQSFIDLTLDKIILLKELKEQFGYHYRINCDGGINCSTIGKVRKAGADVVVTGSAFFNAQNRKNIVDELLDLSVNC